MALVGHSCSTGLPSRTAGHASCSSRVVPAARRQRAQQRVAARRQRQQCRAVSRDTHLWTPDQPGDVYGEEEEFEELETPTEYKGLSREQIGLMGLQPGLNRLGKEPDPVRALWDSPACLQS